MLYEVITSSSSAEAGTASPTYILNHIVNNHDVCHYGDVIQNTHMIQQNVQAAVESTMRNNFV